MTLNRTLTLYLSHRVPIVFLDFIQQKCLVLEEDIQHTWTSILNSMTQMPYDAVKYKSKSKPIGNASMPVSKEGDPPSVPQIAEIASQLDLND